MTIGRYDVHVFRDTGKPRFRVWFYRTPPVSDFDRFLYGADWQPTYLWYFKVMSYWTLFVARRGRARRR
jgi:hypothetical protein